MMLARIAVILALLIGGAQAQMWPFPGPGRPPSGASYVGPGDVVSGARFWYGLRAYSLATVGTPAARICNSGDANCADVNTLSNGDFDVATATGSPLNCDGAGGTCTIRTLYDQTAGNNCTAATCDLGNATAANRPTLTFNCIGSKPCMTFDGTNDVLTSATNLTSTSQPNTFSAVAQTTNTGAARHIVGANGSGATQIGYPTTNNTVQLYAGINKTATASASSYHAFQGVMNASSSDMNIDGTQSTGNSGGQAMSGIVSIGAISASQFMSGQILEAGAWNGVAFTGTQSSNMSSNQHSYWSF